MNLIRKASYSFIALTAIAFGAWLALKTDKSTSAYDIRDQGPELQSASQVLDPTTASVSDNPSDTKNALTAAAQDKELFKTKANKDDNRLTSAIEEPLVGKAGLKKSSDDLNQPVIKDPRAFRSFGKGAAFAINDLPDGKLKENLLALTPNHKATALKWLHSFTFSGIDAIESLRADNRGGIFYTCLDAT